MATDGRYMLANNYRYSVRLLEHCQDNDVPFLYASSAAVYGAGPGVSRGTRLRGAAQRLRLFEVPVRPVRAAGCCPSAPRRSPGFRYFNVYGPREAHKGRMASVVWHFFNAVSSDGQGPAVRRLGRLRRGEQRRDFVSVEDVVSVNLDFLDHPERSGICNLGTGTAATFNAVAAATINACRAAEGQASLVLRRVCIAPARSSTSRFRRRSREQVPELHAGRSVALRAAGLSRRRCSRSRKACRAACVRLLASAPASKP